MSTPTLTRQPTVFADANALYASALRELLLALHRGGAIKLRWSGRVLRECLWALEHRPSRTRFDLGEVAASLEALGPECRVSGYEARARTLSLPDDNDRHVLAAALTAGADVLLTFNFRDFSPRYTRDLPLRVWRPDPFLTALLEQDPDGVRAAAWLVAGQRDEGLRRLRDSLARGAMPRAAKLLAPLGAAGGATAG